VLGTLSLTQGFAPMLAGRAGAAIVNISSVAGLAAFPAFVSYSASKAALHSLTQATRALLARTVSMSPASIRDRSTPTWPDRLRW
jgi:uncharacterized oxidoreductase